MSINCNAGGNRHSHDTVAQVKVCYARAGASSSPGPTVDGSSQGPIARQYARRAVGGNRTSAGEYPVARSAGSDWRADPITPAQEGGIRRRMQIRRVVWAEGCMAPVRKGLASDLIEFLSDEARVRSASDALLLDWGLERAAVRVQAFAGAGSGLEDGPLRPVREPPAAAKTSAPGVRMPREIGEGRYAIASATGNNDLDFFKVTNRGGYVRVYRVIGGRSDTRLSFPVACAAAVRIVALGESGMKLAKEKFGQELGYCGDCGRHLTDQLSRDRGIGPDCWAKKGHG